MKIQFDPNLRYQREAIDSIVDIFEGQEICQTNFTVTPLKEEGWLEGLEQNELGVGNRLRLLDEDILDNVQQIQLRNGLAPSDELDGLNFTVEMETGTGKTYVYLRTIFELNKHYGFTKFIVVVPSVAIKEGVYKSLQMTEDHFQAHYDNTQFDYFVYDSQKLGQVRNFATSDYIQIMVINIDAFRKSFKDPEQEHKANIIHRPHDRMTGRRPIEFIQSTEPIVIVDEPQSVDTTEKSRQAIRSLNPLCTLRYSATHIDKYNMMYRLDSVDAYQRKLVKQIEVAGLEAEDSHNQAYIKLLDVDNSKSPIRAKIELDLLENGQVRRRQRTVQSGTDLLELSGGRSVYDGYIINDIYCGEGNEYIDFTSRPEIVRLNQAIGEVDEDEYKRLQIRKTIEEHLDKELERYPKGIKVLSLFFIDRVNNYRWYDEDGTPRKGKYAQMFEEEYERAIRKPKYQALFDDVEAETPAEEVHNGYFAADRKGNWEDTPDTNQSKNSKKAESAFNEIMRDKEYLLSFDSKLKFIFSHSALREGWDNPNVFQICTLNETGSTLKKRQEIGRGLRIAVNQQGERVHGFDVNTLTIMANESYEDFARQLQKEIEQDEGIKFGVVEQHQFANLRVPSGDGETEFLGVETSESIWQHMQDHGYIDANGKVQDKLRIDLDAGELSLPEEATQYDQQIQRELRKVAGRLNVKNARERKQVQLNKAVYLSEEFQDLWDRIKHRTTFRVDFDPEELIQACVDEIHKSLVVGRPRYRYRKSQAEIDRGGVQMSDPSESTFVSESTDYALPDIVTYLQNETNLTRRTLVEILRRSDRLEDFKRNPQKFIEQVTAIIKDRMQVFIVNGIKYQKLGDQYYYAQELFEDQELYGYLSENMMESEKSVYDYVVYDADNERQLARSFEQNNDVKVYAKLPPGFKIDTPLGGYNPDWAVLVDCDGQERLYFVVESKGSLLGQPLRVYEQKKIECGREHFRALDQDVEFAVADSPERFSEIYAR